MTVWTDFKYVLVATLEFCIFDTSAVEQSSVMTFLSASIGSHYMLWSHWMNVKQSTPSSWLDSQRPHCSHAASSFISCLSWTDCGSHTAHEVSLHYWHFTEQTAEYDFPSSQAAAGLKFTSVHQTAETWNWLHWDHRSSVNRFAELTLPDTTCIPACFLLCKYFSNIHIYIDIYYLRCAFGCCCQQIPWRHKKQMC